MMTWLTRMSFLDTAADLETELLQRVSHEAISLFYQLVYGYGDEDEEINVSHPLYQMWYGYEPALAAYAASVQLELNTRGVQAGDHLELANTMRELRRDETMGDMSFVQPLWMEDADVLRSHRSNLARRWPTFYGKMWAGTPALLPYIWPFPVASAKDSTEIVGYELKISKHDKALVASGKRVIPKTLKDRIVNL